MFIRIATSALLAGAAAGLIAGLLQLVFVQPLLLHAELYESGKLVHFGGQAVSAVQNVGGFDFQRDGLSLALTMVVYTGYAFVLVAAIALAEERGYELKIRDGILWGIAGFVAVQLAPAFSLAPEVPGVAAATAQDRQFWWFPTVAAAAIAMWLIAFANKPALWVLAIVLLVGPHLVGAPSPEEFEGPVPPEIASLFAVRALGVGFVAWVIAGLFAGYFWQDQTDKETV